MIAAEHGAELEDSAYVESEPPPSGPISGRYPSRIPSGLAASNPTSGVLGPALFTSDAGPGYWLAEESLLGMVFVGNEAAPPLEVVRVGPEGIWFARNASFNHRLHSRVQVHLRGEGASIGPLDGKIVPLNARGQGPLLGLKLAALPLPLAREFLRFLNALVADGKAKPAVTETPLKEEIHDRARIFGLLRTLADSDEWGAAVDAPGTRFKVAEIMQEGLVRWQVEGEIPTGTATIELRGYNSVYRMDVTELQRWRDGIVSPAPTRVERIRHRWSRRGKVTGSWSVEFLHPLWDVPVIRRELRDVSFDGLCFTCEIDGDLVFPGLRLPLVKVIGPGGESVQLNGQIRSVLPGRDGQPAVCGMSIAPSLIEDRASWTQFVLRTLNANTDSGPEWTEQLWELFEASGYFNLSGKSPDAFDELKRSFGAVAERASADVRLSCQAVWPSERGVEASCSVLKAYESTWMLHQVAKRRGGFRTDGVTPHVLRDIYMRSFEHVQADPDFRWAISYVEASVPWMQRSHIAFANRHEGEMAMALPFRLMEASCATPGEPGARHYEIAQMTLDERIQLLGVLAQSKPTPYTEALDLVPTRFLLNTPGRAWSDADLDRSRTVLVARRGSKAVAAAILETGEVGTNLFRLLDGVRLFALTPGGVDAYPALLEEAKSWYRARGRESFIYLWEDLQAVAHIDAAGLKDLGEGRFWAVSSDLLPEFLEFVFELTARRTSSAVPAGRVVVPRG